MFLLQPLAAILALGLATTSSARPHGLRPRSCKHTIKPIAPSVALPVVATTDNENATTLASSTPPAATTTYITAATTVPGVTQTPSSTTSNTPSATSKPSPPSNNSDNDLYSMLFPVKPLSSWSTADGVDNHVPLSDSTFRQTNEIKELTHKYVDWEGKKAMQAHYPNGSYNFQHQPRGGISFYAPGPADVDLTTAKEATFGYSVYFPDGFDFVKGGKLPGLYGGDSAEQAISCSGGSRDNACQSIRLMWRPAGAGEFYTYLPPDFDANKRVCDVKPKSECNSVYGASVGRGSFTFATGAWTTVSERVKLNDAGQENGEIELFVGGKSVVAVDGLVIRQGEQGRFRGIMMQTFFGGSTVDWASPKDQDVYFADFSVAITQKF